MKRWAFYEKLSASLIEQGYKVNWLPKRPTMLEHLADVAGHRYLVSGDTLPMHFALGAGIGCVSIFICTSPWEIHDYGIQSKVISANLSEFFYRRDVDPRASTSIPLESVLAAFHELPQR